MLPKDPVMCLSAVNTKLRDEFDSLHELCATLDVDENRLTELLAAIDYHYDETKNQFN